MLHVVLILALPFTTPLLLLFFKVITLTTISEDRDSPAWISEMLPLFDAACNADPGECLICVVMICVFHGDVTVCVGGMGSV